MTTNNEESLGEWSDNVASAMKCWSDPQTTHHVINGRIRTWYRHRRIIIGHKFNNSELEGLGSPPFWVTTNNEESLGEWSDNVASAMTCWSDPQTTHHVINGRIRTWYRHRRIIIGHKFNNSELEGLGSPPFTSSLFHNIKL